MSFNRQVLDDLAEWMDAKGGGRVPVKDLDEFYQERPPHYTSQLHNRLHLLADCAESKVHLVALANGLVKYLEVKRYGRKAYQPMPDFTKKGGVKYAVVETAAEVRTMLEVWQQQYAVLALDFKGISRSDKKIALVQIATMDHRVLLAYTKDNARYMEESGLKDYFEDERRVKVILNSSVCVQAVRAIYGVRIARVFDLTRCFVIAKLGKVPSEKEEYGNHKAGFATMTTEYGIKSTPGGKRDESWTWLEDPLSKAQLEYAARGIAYYCELYDHIMNQVQLLDLGQACFEESAASATQLKKTSPTFQVDGSEPPQPPPSTKEYTGNTVDWMCLSCKAANLAKHTICSACKKAKPKADLLVPVAAASTTAAAAAYNNKEMQQERRKAKLKELGLTSSHCYYFHVDDHCPFLQPDKTCRFIHDSEFKASQERNVSAKKPMRAPSPAPVRAAARAPSPAPVRAAARAPSPAPASRGLMGAFHFQEPEDEALKRAIQESLRDEEKRKGKQHHEQEEQFMNRRAGAAPQQQAQKATQQRASPPAPSLARSSANNDRALLTREITLLCQQLKISEQYIPSIVSCAQASGAAAELKSVNFFKFSLALKKLGMTPAEQKRFGEEVHKRVSGQQQ